MHQYHQFESHARIENENRSLIKMRKNIADMAKRLLSFDFLRGFAIICMAMFHLLVMTADIVEQAKHDPFSLPIFYLIVTVFTIVFAHWRGLFLMISSVVHIYTMTNAIKNGADRKKLWLSQVKFGLILWVFGMFREVFLNEWSFPATVAQGESISAYFAEYWTWIYLMEALEDIAWSIIFTSTIFYFLTSNDGVHKINRNAIVFAILAIIFIALTPLINTAATTYYGLDPAESQPQKLVFDHWWQYIFRLVSYLFVGYNSPLFPMLGYTFTGVVLGLVLTKPQLPAKLTLKVYLIGFALTIFGIVYLVFIQGIPANVGDIIDFQLHPTWYIFFAIGLQLVVIAFVLRRIEFNPKVNLERTVKATKLARLWGITALTIYSFLLIQWIIRWIMGLIFTQYDWLADNALPFGYTVLLIVVDLTVWSLIMVAWEKSKFKYSLEWIFTKIGKKNKPGKVLKEGDILNVEGVYHHPEPIMFVKPLNEQTIKYIVLGNGQPEESS